MRLFIGFSLLIVAQLSVCECGIRVKRQSGPPIATGEVINSIFQVPINTLGSVNRLFQASRRRIQALQTVQSQVGQFGGNLQPAAGQLGGLFGGSNFPGLPGLFGGAGGIKPIQGGGGAKPIKPVQSGGLGFGGVGGFKPHKHHHLHHHHHGLFSNKEILQLATWMILL